MGQTIKVTERPGSRPGVAVYDLNRSLTGMGHERYLSAAEARSAGDRPCDVLARRLFEQPGVKAVHVYSNVVTVMHEPGVSRADLADILADLFTYYREGVEVAEPVLEEPA